MVVFLAWRDLLNTGVPFFCQIKKLSTSNSLENVLILFFVTVILRTLFAIAIKHFAIFIWLCWFDKSSYIFCSKVRFKFNLPLDVVWNRLFFLFLSILLWLFLQREQLTRFFRRNSLLVSLYEPSRLNIFYRLTIIEPFCIRQNILLQLNPIRRLSMVTRIAVIVPDYRRECAFIVFLVHWSWLYGWEASKIRVIVTCQFLFWRTVTFKNDLLSLFLTHCCMTFDWLLSNWLFFFCWWYLFDDSFVPTNAFVFVLLKSKVINKLWFHNSLVIFWCLLYLPSMRNFDRNSSLFVNILNVTWMLMWKRGSGFLILIDLGSLGKPVFVVVIVLRWWLHLLLNELWSI